MVVARCFVGKASGVVVELWDGGRDLAGFSGWDSNLGGVGANLVGKGEWWAQVDRINGEVLRQSKGRVRWPRGDVVCLEL